MVIVNILLFLLFYLLVIPAIALASSFVLRLEKSSPDSDLANAGFLIVFTFLLYLVSITLGTFGILTVPVVLLLSLTLVVILFRSERKGTHCRLAMMFNELRSAAIQVPPLLFAAGMFIFMHLSAPIQECDSLSYHLPNVFDFVSNASTATFDKERLFDPAAITTYYQKGMEAVYAFCYIFPFPRLSVFLLKFLMYPIFYFCLKSASRSRFVAAGIVAVLFTCDVVSIDISSLKNDLPLALLIVYSLCVLKRQRQGLVSFVSLTAALALALGIKANALFYIGVLCPLWLYRERTHPARFIICSAIVALLGGYFFLENLAHTGTPLYPFGVTLFHHTIFPGQLNYFGETTIAASLDGKIVPVFLRGMLCAFGPVGCVLIFCALLAVTWYIARRFIKGRRIPDDALYLLFLLLFGIGYSITPLTDRNAQVPHNLLVSGISLRLGLPFFLWAMVLFSKIAALSIRKIKATSMKVTTGLFTLICLNLMWANMYLLIMKPFSAFGKIAPVAGTFDNLVLGIVFLIAGSLIGLLSVVRWKFTLPIIVVFSAMLCLVQYPSSLSYSSRFKPLGTKITVFKFMEKLDLNNKHIALLSASSYSPFVCAMNDFLLKPGRRVKYIAQGDSADFGEMFIVCAVDSTVGYSMTTGRTSRATLAFFDPLRIPEGYKKVFGDENYLVYVLSELPAPGGKSAKVSFEKMNGACTIDKNQFALVSGIGNSRTRIAAP